MAKHIVTAALPYANGSIHIGHLLEYIQADIYSRFLKLTGHDALYICASDMHGTPIEINAKKAGILPEEFVEKYFKENQEDFKSFLIHFDNYYKTHSEENRELSEYFFKVLKEQNLIYLKEIEQMYDEEAKRFLPDRFIKGTCPKCDAEEQYGDGCEKCGAHYDTTELKNPYSTITNSAPILKSTKHYFFKLSSFSDKLSKWVETSDIQEEVKNWLRNWIKDGLKDWCISRDAPYFGFPIPNSEKEAGAKKFFYVWLDAPIGYISSTKNFTENWKDYWYKGNVTHFLGKDIVYFHYLFWIAMFMGVGIPLPKLSTHGFITINGRKMSKSRGTFFTAKEFRALFHPEAIRFYYASHLDRKVSDVDLNLEDFQAVTNNVLWGNIGNFCNRTLTFANKNYGKIEQIDESLKDEIILLLNQVKKDYTNLNFKSAVKTILQISDKGNQYFQSSEPWKDKESKHAAVGFCVNLARNLSIVLQPILPELSQKVQTSLNESNLNWNDLSFSWKGKVQPPDVLVDQIKELPKKEIFPLNLKVGKIVEVEDHPNADSLYLLKVDFKDKTKQVVAGLKKHFTKNQLLDQVAVFCTNLKPAKLRGELSEAMVLVAEEGELLSLLKINSDLGLEAQFDKIPNNKDQITYDDFKKLTLKVKNSQVIWNDKTLNVNGQPVKTETVPDGAQIF